MTLDNIYSMLYIHNMTRTQLYLPESYYQELKQLAAASGKTFAALTRELLEEKLRDIKKHRAKRSQTNTAVQWLKSLKEIDKWKEKEGITDGSVHHDKYLYGKFMKH